MAFNLFGTLCSACGLNDLRVVSYHAYIACKRKGMQKKFFCTPEK